MLFSGRHQYFTSSPVQVYLQHKPFDQPGARLHKIVPVETMYTRYMSLHKIVCGIYTGQGKYRGAGSTFSMSSSGEDWQSLFSLHWWARQAQICLLANRRVIAAISCCALFTSPAKMSPMGFFAIRQITLVPSRFKTSSL